MKISGFTMVRNAEKYYFPIKESIASILPIVDEFIVALGDCSDNTRAIIESLESPKIRIIDRVWSEVAFVEGKIFADETTYALQQCTGDWCFYLQADEVIHENDLPIIQQACKNYLLEKKVDGLLFNYYHFWGDYAHYLPFHGWYKNEIRIVRNGASIVSYKDAQSFRKVNGQKLNVKAINAHIFHYGWVRPPEIMQSKKKEQDSMHHGTAEAALMHAQRNAHFNFGNMQSVPKFKGSHPQVMKEFMQKIYWQKEINQHPLVLNRPKMKHEKLKYRLLSLIENNLLNGNEIFGYSNWNKI
jgi:glycosyltransferase involved in cell wall biosynthesis